MWQGFKPMWTNTSIIVIFTLSEKLLITSPIPIKWRLDHEILANWAYLQHAKRHGKHQLTTRKCRFIIHPMYDGISLVHLLMLMQLTHTVSFQKGLQNLNVYLSRMILLHWKPARMTNLFLILGWLFLFK